jgi:hypothetical protein
MLESFGILFVVIVCIYTHTSYYFLNAVIHFNCTSTLVVLSLSTFSVSLFFLCHRCYYQPFGLDIAATMMITLQQVIDEQVSFLKEQINPNNKPEVINSTFQIQIHAIRYLDDDDIEKVESVISQEKTLLKNSKDIHESDRLSVEPEALEWLQRQIARYT